MVTLSMGDARNESYYRVRVPDYKSVVSGHRDSAVVNIYKLSFKISFKLVLS